MKIEKQFLNFQYRASVIISKAMKDRIETEGGQTWYFVNSWIIKNFFHKTMLLSTELEVHIGNICSDIQGVWTER